MGILSKIGKKVKSLTTLKNVIAMATGNPFEQAKILKELTKKK